MAAFKIDIGSGFNAQNFLTCLGVMRPLTWGALGTEALGLAGPGFEHLLAEVGRGGAGRHFGELREGDGWDLDVEIDAIQEWSGDFAEVLFHLRRRAATGAAWV